MWDAGFDDLPERLMTHFVGGAWRAPLGTQMQPVLGQGGQVLGHIVCASAADIARAQALTFGPDDQTRRRLGDALQQCAARLAEDLQAILVTAPNARFIQIMAQRYVATGQLFTHESHSLPQRGLVMVPFEHAVLGTTIARIAQVAGLPQGAIAMLHAPQMDQMKRDP